MMALGWYERGSKIIVGESKMACFDVISKRSDSDRVVTCVIENVPF
jgi:hypothetical protein